MRIYLAPFQIDATCVRKLGLPSKCSKYISTPHTLQIFPNQAKVLTNSRNNTIASGSFIPDSLPSIAILALNGAKYQCVDSTSQDGSKSASPFYSLWFFPEPYFETR
jgi:hypothetical protein